MSEAQYARIRLLYMCAYIYDKSSKYIKIYEQNYYAKVNHLKFICVYMNLSNSQLITNDPKITTTYK
jgi:hypothetical protein